MNLAEYRGKRVKIVTDDNKTFIGKATDYIPAQDNTPEIASISIGKYELFEDEIKSIEVIA